MSQPDEPVHLALRRLGVSPSQPTPTINVEEDVDDDTLSNTSVPTKSRPATPRSSTAPSPPTLQGYVRERNERDVVRRNRSPYGRPAGHLRSRSSGTLPAILTRAYSSPLIHSRKINESDPPQAFMVPSPSAESGSASSSARSASPSPARVGSPFRQQSQTDHLDDGSAARSTGVAACYESGIVGGTFEAIQEDSVLDLGAPSPPSQLPSLQPTSVRSVSSRRRPASPLHSVAHAPPLAVLPSTLSSTATPDQNSVTSQPPHSPGFLTPSGAHSPSFGPQRYNEAFPALHHHGSAASLTSTFSSLPSTPTSARSRSPSISSLGTIEDNPDLEVEAMELDRQERLHAAVERTDGSADEEEGPRRRSSFDMPRGFGFGSSRGRVDQRKRWSVCGGERRGDLDLETIWED